MKHYQCATLWYFAIPIFFAFLLSSCKSYSPVPYWKKHLPAIVADSTGHRVVDTLIRNKKTAIAVAMPILIDKFGKKMVRNEKPYRVLFLDGYWIIDGHVPKCHAGGAITIILRATDGKVMQLVHYR